MLHAAQQPDGFKLDALAIFLQGSAPGWSDRVGTRLPLGSSLFRTENNPDNTAAGTEEASES
jgi:hypothetical protein